VNTSLSPAAALLPLGSIRRRGRRDHNKKAPAVAGAIALLGSSRRRPFGSTRTLLIQRGRNNPPNFSNLLTFTRVRVTRCWSLLGFMLDFAVLYSLKC
jgi:hypothetical protein